MALGIRLGGIPPYSAWEDVCYRRLINGNNFATSAALAEACALLSVILVLMLIRNGELCCIMNAILKHATKFEDDCAVWREHKLANSPSDKQ